MEEIWQNRFERLTLEDNARSKNAVQHGYAFQHGLDGQKDTIRMNNTSPVTLDYRSSIASTASTSSRYSTFSSMTSFRNSLNSPTLANLDTPPLSRASTLNKDDYIRTTAPQISLSNVHNTEKLNVLSPIQASSPELIQQLHSSLSQINVIDPNGCFVPCKALPLIQKNDTTRHHFVVPTFTMASQNQADMMKLLFSYTDNKPLTAREEYERTIPFHVDYNTSILTLSQFNISETDTPTCTNCLEGLGQRLGITSIVIVVSLDAIDTAYYLLDNVARLIGNNAKETDNSHWSRVILVVDQQHGIDDQIAYSQRKSFLIHEMPRIQQRYNLTQPLSMLFLSTQVYHQIENISRGADYKRCCQRILWQMMYKHNLSGRWGTETAESQGRLNSMNAHTTVNILTEEDESSSSSDEDSFGPQIINYVDFKEVKTKKLIKKKHDTQVPQLQRRVTRRMFQKLNCYDDDNGRSLPH